MTTKVTPLGHCVIGQVDPRVPAKGSHIRVIGHRADQLLTDSLTMHAHIVDGLAEADVTRDVLKMAVIERHGRNGNVGVGFIKGIGLTRGAIAGTVAHDHHNLVVIGADDLSMQTAIDKVRSMQGGLAAADGAQVCAALALPVAGLMSDEPIEAVAVAYQKLIDAAKTLGSPLADPFMAMSFMALEVIPSLKLTDQGLIDVESFEKVGLFA